MSSLAAKRLGTVLVILQGLGGCVGPGLKKLEPQFGAQSARSEVIRHPCGLLRAIRDALTHPLAAARSKSTWAISFDSEGCCSDARELDLRSAIVAFGDPDPDAPNLIDWGDKCENGFGGPEHLNDGTIAFHYLYIFDKGSSELAFSITPSWVEFEKGKKKNDLLQGCPDAQGTARFLGR